MTGQQDRWLLQIYGCIDVMHGWMDDIDAIVWTTGRLDNKIDGCHQQMDKWTHVMD